MISVKHIQLAMLVCLVAIVGYDVLVSLSVFVGNRFYFNDDVMQQIAPFHYFANDGPSVQSLHDSYYVAIMPYGYQFFYKILASFADLRNVHKYVTMVVLFTTAIIGALIVKPRSNWVTALATALFIICSHAFIAKISGGLPRSLAYLIIMVQLYFCLKKQWLWAGVTVVVASLFYPVGALIAGVLWGTSLSIYYAMTVAQTTKLPPANALIKHGAYVLVTLVLCAGILIMFVNEVTPFGSAITAEEMALYPELEEGGRYGSNDRLPHASYAKQAFVAVVTSLSFYPTGALALTLSVFLLPLACVLLIRYFWQVRNYASFVLLAILAVSALLYHVAMLVFPLIYFPERYSIYLIPIFMALALPLATYRWITLAKTTGNTNITIALVCTVGAYSMLMLMRDSHVTLPGVIHYQHQEQHAPMYQFIEQLSPTSMIAAWPNGVANHITYQGKRASFLNFESHQVLHDSYAKQMRERSYALIDAYFATNSQQVLEVVRRYGITHFIIDKQHLQTRPDYFKPFNGYIKNKLTEHKLSDAFLFSEDVEQQAIYDDHQYYIVDVTSLKTAN